MFNPDEPLFLQWHITDACDLACRHCYRGARVPDLELADLKRILENFIDLRRFLPQRKARVQLAGGEPLISRHLYDLIQLIVSAGLHVRILSNGQTIDAGVARRLKDCGCAIMQISLEGGEASHDAIRGRGTFARALQAAEHLRRNDIQVTFAMTLSRVNAADVPEVLALALNAADRVGFHRLVPCGRGRDLQAELLAPEELEAVFETIWQFKQAHPELDIPLRDPLWKPFVRCPEPDEYTSGCSAGYAGICVEANGDVLPCRRLPIVLGNALRDSLRELWDCEQMRQLRDRSCLQGRCGACQLKQRCGGCRAIPYAIHGQALGEDPQCFYRPSLAERWLRRASQYVHDRNAKESLDGG